jgi:hypothetical protein
LFPLEHRANRAAYSAAALGLTQYGKREKKAQPWGAAPARDERQVTRYFSGCLRNVHAMEGGKWFTHAHSMMRDLVCKRGRAVNVL